MRWYFMAMVFPLDEVKKWMNGDALTLGPAAGALIDLDQTTAPQCSVLRCNTCVRLFLGREPHRLSH
jgi:hypothetical protein